MGNNFVPASAPAFVDKTDRCIKLLLLYVFYCKHEIRNLIFNMACVCMFVRERQTDRLPQVLKPGIYHSLLIPPLLSSASPLAGALWLGRKTAVWERPVLMISPLCASSDFTTSLSKQNSCGTYWTCVRIGNPRPAEEKRQSEGYSRPECALQVASESVEGIALGNQVLLFIRVCCLGSLS